MEQGEMDQKDIVTQQSKDIPTINLFDAFQEISESNDDESNPQVAFSEMVSKIEKAEKENSASLPFNGLDNAMNINQKGGLCIQ